MSAFSDCRGICSIAATSRPLSVPARAIAESTLRTRSDSTGSRGFVTYGSWSNLIPGTTVANGVFGTDKNGLSWGFQAEAWW